MNARLTSGMRRLALTVLVWAAALATSAHVGSPDVFHSGKAGPYEVRVVVRPPAVIPGRAQVTVRVVGTPAATHVEVVPAYWRTGSRGAPAGDTLVRVPGPEALFQGEVWLMTRGAWTLGVRMHGAAGDGAVNVPISALSTAKLAMPAVTKGALLLLGALLLTGMMSLVRAAVSESTLPPGVEPDARQQRRGRIAFAVTGPLLALALFGGWRWVKAEDRVYTERMLRLWQVTAGVRGDTLRLAIRDTMWLKYRASGPLMPDHGKMMHLFLVQADGSGFGHLHPIQRDSASFVTALPPLPPGRYRLFGDIVHETGFERTLVTQVMIPRRPRDVAKPDVPVAMDPDDAWSVDVPRAVRGVAKLPGGAKVAWADGVPSPRAGEVVPLRFVISDSGGEPIALEPYLGMRGHAVVMREDGQVYVHLHPSGSTSMAARQAFELRDRGDTTRAGRLRLDDSAGADMVGHVMTPETDDEWPGEVEFPYAFPQPGEYRVWVQLRLDGKVETARFDVMVRGPLGVSR
jgi:hypothetical protein